MGTTPDREISRYALASPLKARNAPVGRPMDSRKSSRIAPRTGTRLAITLLTRNAFDLCAGHTLRRYEATYADCTLSNAQLPNGLRPQINERHGFNRFQ